MKKKIQRVNAAPRKLIININAINILQSALCETWVKTKFSKINNKISFSCETISDLETTFLLLQVTWKKKLSTSRLEIA